MLSAEVRGPTMYGNSFSTSGVNMVFAPARKAEARAFGVSFDTSGTLRLFDISLRKPRPNPRPSAPKNPPPWNIDLNAPDRPRPSAGRRPMIPAQIRPD